MGAVFNRDYQLNRGGKPLPPTLNYSLNNIEFFVVSNKGLSANVFRVPGSTVRES